MNRLSLCLACFLVASCSQVEAPETEIYYGLDDAGLTEVAAAGPDLENESGYSEVCIEEALAKHCLLLEVWELDNKYFVTFYANDKNALSFFNKEVQANLISDERYERISSLVPKGSKFSHKPTNLTNVNALHPALAWIGRILKEATIGADPIGKDPHEIEADRADRERRIKESKERERQARREHSERAREREANRRREERERYGDRVAWEHGCRGC